MDEFILPNEILNKLYESDSIKQMLKSQKLQDLLTYIDSSNDKEQILENQMKNNEDFKSFINKVLKKIGIREGEGMSVIS